MKIKNSKMTKVLRCSSCKDHPFQDRKYGNKMRVHNRKEQNKGTCTQYTCTVCSNVQDIAGLKKR